MKKYFIIDLLPEFGTFATTMFGDICTTSVPRLATKFGSRKEATEYMREHFSGYHTAKVRSLAVLEASK